MLINPVKNIWWSFTVESQNAALSQRVESVADLQAGSCNICGKPFTKVPLLISVTLVINFPFVNEPSKS